MPHRRMPTLVGAGLSAVMVVRQQPETATNGIVIVAATFFVADTMHDGIASSSDAASGKVG